MRIEDNCFPQIKDDVHSVNDGSSLCTLNDKKKADRGHKEFKFDHFNYLRSINIGHIMHNATQQLCSLLTVCFGRNVRIA